jgi:hypothetical protein
LVVVAAPGFMLPVGKLAALLTKRGLCQGGQRFLIRLLPCRQLYARATIPQSHMLEQQSQELAAVPAAEALVADTPAVTVVQLEEFLHLLQAKLLVVQSAAILHLGLPAAEYQ